MRGFGHVVKRVLDQAAPCSRYELVVDKEACRERDVTGEWASRRIFEAPAKLGGSHGRSEQNIHLRKTSWSS